MTGLFQPHYAPGGPGRAKASSVRVKTFTCWSRWSAVETALIEPEKAWQNGTDESFNGSLRDECLNRNRFATQTEARAV